jgi:Flp pilus assembly protein TadD
MGSDFYTPGQDLSRRAILQILLEEVYRGGTASEEERKTVRYLRKALKLEDDAYKAVKARVKELFKAGQLAGPGEMDPVRVYRRAIELAYADGKVSGKERVYLKVLGKVLWITPEEHARVVRELKAAAATPAEEALPVPDTTELGLKDPDMPAEPPPARTAARTLESLPKPPPALAASPPPAAPSPPRHLEQSDGDSSGGGSGVKATPGERARPVAPGATPSRPAPAAADFPASVAELPEASPAAGSGTAPARSRERERTRPIPPRAAAPPPEAKATPPAAPPEEPEPKPPPPEPEPAPAAAPPRASRPTGTYAPQRATGAHAQATGTSRSVKAPAVAKPEEAISKPVLYGGLGALGLVLLLFLLQKALVGPAVEDEPEPARPAVEEPVKRPEPPPVAKPPPVNLQVDKHLASGLQALQAGKLEEAIADYKKAVALEDKQAFVHNNLGHAYERKGDDDAAMKEYQRAIELDPKYPLAYNNLGTIYERKGRTMEAMALYRKSVELKPDYGNAHYNLGVMYGRAGRYDEAIVHFRKVVELRPTDAYAHKDLWLAYSRKGMEAEARKELEEARKLGLKIGE